MIRESHIDQALNRVLEHFGNRVRVRPPATASEMAELESIGANLPRDLVILLSTCNGLRIRRTEPLSPWHLCGTHDMMKYIRTDSPTGALPGLVPIRDDGAGVWMVLQCGPLHGVILHWMASSEAPTLLASDLENYVDALSHYWVDRFDRQGRPLCGDDDEPDAEYMQKFDSALNALFSSAKVRDALMDYELLASGGADLD